MGNDFYFSNAKFSFEYIDGMKYSMEKLAPSFLNISSFEFRYSTLTDYMEDMKKINYTIGKYEGDFFVYTQYKPSGFYDHHWGGYFTSRPMFKWMTRTSHSRERALNSLMATVKFTEQSNSSHIDPSQFENAFNSLKSVREFNPVMLHHDAITGTHGNAVNADYKRKIQSMQNSMDDTVGKLRN